MDAGPSPGAATFYDYDPDGRILGRYDATGQPIEEYIYVDDVLVSVVRPQGVYAVQTDHLGTPRAVVDAAGVTVWTWSSEPYGGTPPITDPDGDLQSFVLDERFPGQRFDEVTGMNQNFHRNYMPELARYAETDPIGIEGGLNVYAYVGGNPLMNFDTLGLATAGGDPSLGGDKKGPKRIPTSDAAVLAWLCKAAATGDFSAFLMGARQNGQHANDDNLAAAERFSEFLGGNYDFYSPVPPTAFNAGQVVLKKGRDWFNDGRGNGSKDAFFVGKWGQKGVWERFLGKDPQSWIKENCPCAKQ